MRDGVYFEGLLDAIDALFENDGARANAGVVDEDCGRAELGADLRGCVLDIGGRGYVGFDEGYVWCWKMSDTFELEH